MSFKKINKSINNLIFKFEQLKIAKLSKIKIIFNKRICHNLINYLIKNRIKICTKIIIKMKAYNIISNNNHNNNSNRVINMKCLEKFNKS